MKLALARINYSQLYGVYDEGMTYEQRDILIPYHLLILATRAYSSGIDVKIFDAEVGLLSEEQLVDEILAWKPDFVGISATTPDIQGTIKVCRLLKLNNLSIKTIVGGCHATAMPESIQSIYVDFIVKGYGESVITEIIKGYYSPGIIVSSLECPQDRPAYYLLDYSDYKFTDPICGRVNAASVMSAYGCPFDCTFCFHSKYFRCRNVGDFIHEVEYLYNCKDVRYFYIYDDVFLLSKKRVFQILKKLKRFKQAHFQCYIRANLIDKDVVKEMRESNFVRVSMGLESGSDEILKRISKRIVKQDAIRACQLLHTEGIETRASFILGLPYETHKTINETIEFSKELELYHANFNIMTPYPGTVIYEMALRGEGLYFEREEYKIEWSEYRRWGRAIIRTDDLTAKELESYQIKAQVEFYSQPKIFEYYYNLFRNGNKSRYFYRPLNFAWEQKFNQCVPFWNELEKSGTVNPKKSVIEERLTL